MYLNFNESFSLFRTINSYYKKIFKEIRRTVDSKTVLLKVIKKLNNRCSYNIREACYNDLQGCSNEFNR